MWSGIANFLFGNESAEVDHSFEVLDILENFEEGDLTLRPAEEDEWFLVECPESRTVPVETLTSPATENEVEVRPASERPAVRRGSRLSGHPSTAHNGPIPVLTVTRFPVAQPPKDRWLRGRKLTRKALELSNKVCHHQSKCKKQRHYNYKLCYSNKNERKC